MPPEEPGVSPEELRALEESLGEDSAEAAPAAPPAAHADHAHEEGHGEPPYQAIVAQEPEPTLGAFFSSWDLFGDSALAGALAGCVLGFLGVYIVLRRMVFLSAALSQTASLGIVGAFFLHAALGWTWLEPTWGALLMTLGAILWLTSPRASGARHDGMLGVVFLAGSAGTLALGTRIVQELHDVQTILFGTAVAVAPGDLRLMAAMSAALTLLHLGGWRGFVAVIYDADDAQVRGLPTALLGFLLVSTIALAVSVSTGILGALPTFAFSVLPALAALRLASNVQRAMWLAALLGAVSGFGGYVLAFLYELPVGAAQAIVALCAVPLCSLLARLRR